MIKHYRGLSDRRSRVAKEPASLNFNRLHLNEITA
jgi:hypothetical protein